MSKGSMYLSQILQKYSAQGLIDYSQQINSLKIELRAWANRCYIDILDSGSHAKGTAISLASDIDFLVSLTSTCNENKGGLKSIYDSLYIKLSTLYPNARKQSVSVRINIPNYTRLFNGLEGSFEFQVGKQTELTLLKSRLSA